MKTTGRSKFLLLLTSILIAATTINAQRPARGGQVAVIGWEDDNYYLLRTTDQEQNPVVLKVNIRTGKSAVSKAPKTAREILDESLPGDVASAAGKIYSPDFKSVLFVRDNDLWLFTSIQKELRRLTTSAEEEVNARFSPDGRRLAYTRNRDLYVFDIPENREIRLTSDASDDVYNGYAAWVYYEEILGRPSRYAAFWWAPDGNRIAYLRFDESEVPVFTLNRLDEPDGVHGKLEVVHYPKPGDNNPKVKMGIAEIATGKTTWVKTDYSVDQYIAWPFWTPDSRKLAIQVLNRDQNNLKIILADPLTGDFQQIYEESYKTWIEFHEDIHVLQNGSGFILRSYKNGWENLYFVPWEGIGETQLTDLDFRVTSINRVDENLKTIWFSATGTESTDNHVFRVGLDGTGLLQLTAGSGSHNVNISPGGRYYIDTWNSIDDPGAIVTYTRNGKMLKEVHRFEKPDYDPEKHPKAELVYIPTFDGLFKMPAVITYPLNFNPSSKYPVVFTIYGGPDSKNVSSRWQGTNPSFYAQNGIITFSVDHRGSGHFGKKGLDYLHRSLGKWELLDYADAVQWLRQKPFVDPQKIGITGSSYGGYMTCMALTKGAEYWTHGFAGSSVTDWRLYDNVYTERYMDTPADNPEGYRDGSALTFATGLKGKLYMTHGDMDDNVHMQNSIYLISRLQDAGKRFRFMLYPNGRHGWGGAKALHSRNEANQFWLENFFGD
ncbi:MAG TPA: S9 family peptidase [Bacteroidales bacterium]|nr:S9 family peptidase [Bacteroidales bacterium]HPR11620.1 S9 family peptidase [Bacteroidales bacterium]